MNENGKCLHMYKPCCVLQDLQPNEKVNYYATILDKVKGRSNIFPSSGHQRLLVGLLDNVVRAKVDRKSSALLKTMHHEAPQASLQHCNPTRQFRHQFPHMQCPPYMQCPDACYRRGYAGHYTRDWMECAAVDASAISFWFKAFFDGLFVLQAS